MQTFFPQQGWFPIGLSDKWLLHTKIPHLFGVACSLHLGGMITNGQINP